MTMVAAPRSRQTERAPPQTSSRTSTAIRGLVAMSSAPVGLTTSQSPRVRVGTGVGDTNA